MQIIPVIDLLGGAVVRGVAGKRSEYRPVESALAVGSNSIDIARAFRETLGLSRIYLADLDGILHRRPSIELYRELTSDGFELLVDAGIRTVDDAAAVLEAGAKEVVAALETSPGPNELRTLCRTFDPAHIVFSLDLTNGRPMTASNAWSSDDPLAIAVEAAQAGAEQMIVLDLSNVGIGSGISTFELCRKIRERCSPMRLITGGGVRCIDDVRALESLGLEGVLVASALHSGAIGASELHSLRSNTNG